MISKSKGALNKLVCLAALGIFLAPCSTEAAQVETSRTVNQPNMAARELERDTAAMRPTKGLAIPLENLFIPRSQVSIEGNSYMSEKRVRELLPELQKEEINVRRLSLQIQLANSSGAVNMAVKLHPQAEGKFSVRVLVAEQKHEHVVETVNNSGNKYTGNWRMITSYINSNLSGRTDTLGVSYVTAPGHWDDVKQAAVSYRKLLPKASGEVNVFAGWSGVDMGQLYNDGTMSYYAEGDSHNLGVNFIHHLSYSTKEKDSWEFGLEHKNYTSKWGYTFGSLSEDFKNDYALDELTVRFRHQERKPHSFFGWNVALVQSLFGDADDYQRGTKGANSGFTLLRAGTQYQYRTKKNWLATGRLQAQYSRQNVISPEQLGMGGMNALRGYNERTLNGDRGFIGSLELYTPELLPKLRALVFTDFASLYNNNESTKWKSEGASTAGLGLRYSDRDNGLYVSLDYVAKVMNEINRDIVGNPSMKRWNLVLTKVF